MIHRKNPKIIVAIPKGLRFPKPIPISPVTDDSIVFICFQSIKLIIESMHAFIIPTQQAISRIVLPIALKWIN
jgi:hypothetical protein